jgi:hypothetical protein
MFAALADKQNAYYGRQLPNLILSPELPSGTRTPTQYADTVGVYDPYTKSIETNKGDWASYLKGVEIDQELKNKAAICRAAKNPEELAGTVNYGDKVRCGWIYKKGPTGSPEPEISEGALGTKNGPLSFLPHNKGGQWFWNLTEAQKQIDKTRCDCLKDCRDVGGADFYGKCGFCKGQSRGIPIKPDGSIKYATEPLLSCSPTNLIREVGSCPPPPAPGSPAAMAASQDICAMDANGQVSRNCILNRLMAAGCSDQGSVAIALQTGATPDNYARALESVPSFQKYQLFSTTPLNSDVLRQGKGSAQVALTEFQRLAKDSKTVDETTAVGAASRDLCTKKGVFDNYDFCTELADASRAPFALECLQKEFRKQGGQPAGTLYPVDTSKGNPLQAELDAMNADLKYLRGLGLGPGSGNATFDDRYARQKALSEQVNAGNTFNYWNTKYNTWGDVRAAMKQIAANTKSTDKNIQSVSLKQFLGIAREQPTLNQIEERNGFEIFFFPYPGNGSASDDKLTFLGRRVLGGEDFPQIPDWSTGPKFQTGFTEMHFAIITNLRPKADENNIAFQVSTDDGTALSVNIDIDPVKTNASEPNYFGRFFSQAPTSYQNVCTQLTTGGPNYVTIRYYDGGGASAFRLQFRNCTSGQVKTIPSYMFSLTQEPAAPYASFEVITRDNAMFFEELRLGRGLFKTVTAGNGRTEILNSAPQMPGGLIPYRVGAGASWQIKTRMAYQSLRTITIVWSPENTASSDSTIFYWGDNKTGFRLTMNGQKLSASWQMGGATLQGTMPAPLGGSGPYYTRITFEAQNAILPNRIRVATVPMSVNDITRLDMDTNQIILTPQNGILFSRYIQDKAMAGFMGIGAAPGETTQPNPVGLQIGFLHIFDYILDAPKTQIDVTGQWKRKFIY